MFILYILIGFLVLYFQCKSWGFVNKKAWFKADNFDKILFVVACVYIIFFWLTRILVYIIEKTVKKEDPLKGLLIFVVDGSCNIMLLEVLSKYFL